MKAVRFDTFGTPHEVAHAVDVAEPGAPAAGEVLVEVEAFPINPVDLLTIAGRYATRPTLPAVPGAEALGRVMAIGAGVTHVAPGDRVLMMGRENWVQHKILPAHEAIPARVVADPLQLAMLKVNPPTAKLMLEKFRALQSGDWVIQNAANSGVGTCLIALAKVRGLHTVNVVRREELVTPLQARGADVVVVDGPDLADRVRAASDGAAIGLAIDAVAGDATGRLAECLSPGGTVVNYGLLSGEPCRIGPGEVVFRGITLTGFWLVKALGAMSAVTIIALYADLAARVADGTLRVAVEATYPIDDIQAALAHAGREGRNGKILVTPNGPLGGR